MKVLIITWMKYNNYGTVLQAYALQKKIKLLGYDVKTLDDHGVGFDLIDRKIGKFEIILKLIKYVIINVISARIPHIIINTNQLLIFTMLFNINPNIKDIKKANVFFNTKG